MDVDDTPDEAAHRVRVRDLLAEHGGRGDDLAQQAVAGTPARARVPGLVDHLGIGLGGPTVLAHGTPDQHERYLLRPPRTDDARCPVGGGTDLGPPARPAAEHHDVVAGLVLAGAPS